MNKEEEMKIVYVATDEAFPVYFLREKRDEFLGRESACLTESILTLQN